MCSADSSTSYELRFGQGAETDQASIFPVVNGENCSTKETRLL